MKYSKWVISVSRKWVPGEPMDVLWERVRFGMSINAVNPSSCPINSTSPQFGRPGGPEYPMLERPYTGIDEILIARELRRMQR